MRILLQALHDIPELFLLGMSEMLLLLSSSMHYVLDVALMGDQLVLGIVPEGVLAVLADDVQGREDIDGVIDPALDIFELYILI